MTILRSLCILFVLTLCACGDPDSVEGSLELKQAGKVGSSDQGIAPAERSSELPDAPALLDTWFGDLDGMQQRGLIRVLTVYGVGRYYLDGAEEKGLVLEVGQLFEKFSNERFKREHTKIQVVLIPLARDQLIPALIAGRGDVIIAGLSITEERQEQLDFSRPATKPLSEILVTGPSAPDLESIDDLSGKTVYVRQSSSYRESVEALNTRLVVEGKSEIKIELVSELLEDDDLIEMVNAGLLPWVIVDEYKMHWWGEAFSELQAREDIVFRSDIQMAWGIRKNSPQLEKSINDFLAKNREGTLIGNVLMNRYIRDYDWPANALSDDDYSRFKELEGIFQKYGELYGIEYLLVAAQAYQESRFDQSIRNRSGAMGVMQIKPSTAGDHNVNIKNIHEVEANIHAGVKYLDFLRDRYFNDPDIDKTDQLLLALAAYNMGPARVIDLRKKTEKMGYDPNIWFDNVEIAAAKNVGREPVQYVANIYKYYMAYLMSAEQVLQRGMARERAGIDN
jgi:membrane-bound lytic murein transglycosylase MltF